MPQALAESLEPKVDLKPAQFGFWVAGAAGAGVGALIGAAGVATRVNNEVARENARRQSDFSKKAAETTSFVDDTLAEYDCNLEMTDYCFNKANAIKIDSEGIYPMEIVQTDSAKSVTDCIDRNAGYNEREKNDASQTEA